MSETTTVRLTMRHDTGDEWLEAGSVQTLDTETAQRLVQMKVAEEYTLSAAERLRAADGRDGLKDVIDALGLEVDKRQSYEDLLDAALDAV